VVDDTGDGGGEVKSRLKCLQHRDPPTPENQWSALRKSRQRWRLTDIDNMKNFLFIGSNGDRLNVLHDVGGSPNGSSFLSGDFGDELSVWIRSQSGVASKNLYAMLENLREGLADQNRVNLPEGMKAEDAQRLFDECVVELRKRSDSYSLFV
jgi:hypothetical protein